MLPKTPMIDEEFVEDLVYAEPALVGSPTVQWQARQVPVLGTKGDDRADLLGVDAAGVVVIGEVKRGVVWPAAIQQARRYVSALQLGWDDGGWGELLGLTLTAPLPRFRIALIGQLIEPSTRAAAAEADVPVCFAEVIDELPGPRPRRPGHPKYTLWLSTGTAPAGIVPLLEGTPGIRRDDLIDQWQALKTRGKPEREQCAKDVDYWTGHARGGAEVLGASTEHAGPWTPIVSARYNVEEDASGGLHLQWDPGW
jgi:hypothetical protein